MNTAKTIAAASATAIAGIGAYITTNVLGRTLIKSAATNNVVSLAIEATSVIAGYVACAVTADCIDRIDQPTPIMSYRKETDILAQASPYITFKKEKEDTDPQPVEAER